MSDIYSHINGDIHSLLLVDGTHVVNGDYDLTRLANGNLALTHAGRLGPVSPHVEFIWRMKAPCEGEYNVVLRMAQQILEQLEAAHRVLDQHLQQKAALVTTTPVESPNCPTCGSRLSSYDSQRQTWWCGPELREVRDSERRNHA